MLNPGFSTNGLSWVVIGTTNNYRSSCFRFHAIMHTAKSGFFGYAIRILPHHPDAVTQFMPLLITWASESTVATPELALK